MKKPEVTLPTILGLFIAAFGLVTGIWLVNGQLKEAAKAAEEEAPKEVKVTNISDVGFSVSWITDKAVTGYIKYGEGNPDLVVSDERDQQKGQVESYFTHYVTVKALKPATLYNFSIGSGKGSYNNDGSNYKVTTGITIAETPVADVAYGQVSTAGGDPAEGAIVYLSIEGAVLQSALVKQSGTWVIPLSTARTNQLSGYLKYDKETSKVELYVQGGPLETAKYETTTANDSPVKEIVLGKTKTDTAELKVISPQGSINSSRPQIEGTAPPGAEITIEVHSDQVITATTTADGSGNFSYIIPQDLSPGVHTVTIKAMINGTIQTVTNSFTVYAAETNLPMYSATPSATLAPTIRPTNKPTATPTTRPGITATPTRLPSTTPTLIPTKTIIPTRTPVPTRTPTPTHTPTPTRVPTATLIPTLRVAYPASGSATPVSGDVDGTIYTLLAGSLFIGLGWLCYRKAA